MNKFGTKYAPMPGSIKNPHDHFLKAILEDAEVAYHFFLTFLPEQVIDILDLSTLAQEATSFITPELKGQFSDTIFKVQARNREHTVLVSLLLEHKSTPDKYTSIQVLSYLGLAYHKQSKGKDGIHPIIPMVFYHGKKQWQFQTVTALIGDLPATLKPFIPDYETVFIDLVRMPDQAIHSIEQLFLQSALTTQKYAHNPKALEAQIVRIFSTLGPYRDRNLFRQLFVYFYKVYEIRGEDPRILLTKIPETIKHDFMTLYDAIKNEGIEQGIEQGVAQGIEQGVAQGKIEERTHLIVNGYQMGLSIEMLAQMSQLNTKSVEEILLTNGLILPE